MASIRHCFAIESFLEASIRSPIMLSEEVDMGASAQDEAEKMPMRILLADDTVYEYSCARMTLELR